jgi:hypothetical protein
MSPDLHALMSAMLDPSPLSRITAAGIRLHPLVAALGTPTATATSLLRRVRAHNRACTCASFLALPFRATHRAASSSMWHIPAHFHSRHHDTSARAHVMTHRRCVVLCRRWRIWRRSCTGSVRYGAPLSSRTDRGDPVPPPGIIQ